MRNTGTPGLAILALSALSMALAAGCGEKSEPALTPSVSAAQGSSFDAPVSPKASEPKEEVVIAPQPVQILASDKKEENVAPLPVEAPTPVVETPKELKAPPPTPAAEIPAPAKEVLPPPPPPAPKVAEAEAKKEVPNEPPMVITFAKLAGYRYYPPASRTKTGEKAAAKSPIPETVRALDGKKVTIEGYMIPLDIQKGKILSFILSRGAFGCCYGDSPQINEVIKVISADGKPMSYQSTPRVSGILEVGEEYDPDGYIDSIYRIKADAVTAGKER